MKMQMQQMSVLELDDLYYRLHAEGATLQDLKAVRSVQERKMMELSPEERNRLRKAIRDRFVDSMLSPSLRRSLGSGF